jgi:hypothetical protein
MDNDIVIQTPTFIEECENKLPEPLRPFLDFDAIFFLANDFLPLQTFFDEHTLGRLLSFTRNYTDREAYENSGKTVTSQGVFKADPSKQQLLLWKPRSDYYSLVAFLCIYYLLTSEKFSLDAKLSDILLHPKFEDSLADLFAIDTELRLRRALQVSEPLHGAKIAFLISKNGKRVAFDITYSNDPPATDLTSLPRPYFSCSSCYAFPTLLKKLSKCSRCENSYYCNQKCQRKDWKNHKPLCDILYKE